MAVTMPMIDVRPDSAPLAAPDGWWEAVARRDRSADGRFVYAVRTTGVYCRPTCPARLARRENVEFFRSSAAAERAGYRPCRRCRPQDPTGPSPAGRAVDRACRLIESSSDPVDLDALAADAGLSRSRFARVFRSMTGLTPRQYAAAQRGRRVRDALSRGQSVTTAIYNAGFGSNGRFYESAARLLGMPPSAFRAGGAGATVRFAVGQCAYGSILVAASQHGICSIALGDDPDALVRQLQDRFPNAELVGGDAAFERLVAHVVAFVEEPSRGLELPLEVRGTAFQHRIWRKLCEIPPGQTRTYSQIALELGMPSATRAVAGACAANTLAVAIPCHRVVRTDRSLTGYRWGIERKARLLAAEGAIGTGR